MQIVETNAPKISLSYPIRLKMLSQAQGNLKNCIIPLRIRDNDSISIEKYNKESDDKNYKSKSITNKEGRTNSKALECYCCV